MTTWKKGGAFLLFGLVAFTGCTVETGEVSSPSKPAEKADKKPAPADKNAGSAGAASSSDKDASGAPDKDKNASATAPPADKDASAALNAGPTDTTPPTDKNANEPASQDKHQGEAASAPPPDKTEGTPAPAAEQHPCAADTGTQNPVEEEQVGTAEEQIGVAAAPLLQEPTTSSNEPVATSATSGEPVSEAEAIAEVRQALARTCLNGKPGASPQGIGPKVDPTWNCADSGIGGLGGPQYTTCDGHNNHICFKSGNTWVAQMFECPNGCTRGVDRTHDKCKVCAEDPK